MTNIIDPLVQVKSLGKRFVNKEKETEVLRDIDFGIARGTVLGIVGPSGAGKSTLLHILGTLDRPSSGQVFYDGQDIFSWDDGKQAEFRNNKLGFIFQFHHLMPEFNALENTMMPALIAGMDKKKAKSRSKDMLVRMGLEQRLNHKQGELSGGEQQRVAVARALIMYPEIVLADEPTGNLDSHTGEEVFNLLFELNAEMSLTFVIVTHNESFSRKIPHRITLLDGQIKERN
jgi:lipoprotein-releasing system ATP-binding protein